MWHVVALDSARCVAGIVAGAHAQLKHGTNTYMGCSRLVWQAKEGAERWACGGGQAAAGGRAAAAAG